MFYQKSPFLQIRGENGVKERMHNCSFIHHSDCNSYTDSHYIGRTVRHRFKIDALADYSEQLMSLKLVFFFPNCRLILKLRVFSGTLHLIVSFLKMSVRIN